MSVTSLRGQRIAIGVQRWSGQRYIILEAESVSSPCPTRRQSAHWERGLKKILKDEREVYQRKKVEDVRATRKILTKIWRRGKKISERERRLGLWSLGNWQDERGTRGIVEGQESAKTNPKQVTGRKNEALRAQYFRNLCSVNLFGSNYMRRCAQPVLISF